MGFSISFSKISFFMDQLFYVVLCCPLRVTTICCPLMSCMNGCPRSDSLGSFFQKEMICMSCRCVKLAFLEFAWSVWGFPFGALSPRPSGENKMLATKNGEHLHAKSWNLKFQFITANEAQIPIFIVQIFLSTLNLVKGYKNVADREIRWSNTHNTHATHPQHTIHATHTHTCKK